MMIGFLGPTVSERPGRRQSHWTTQRVYSHVYYGASNYLRDMHNPGLVFCHETERAVHARAFAEVYLGDTATHQWHGGVCQERTRVGFEKRNALVSLGASVKRETSTDAMAWGKRVPDILTHWCLPSIAA